ncbi:murein hydrolase activator EnvC, partial [Clostridium sp.]|uniref:murein hydrolase activator EnvC n=1 Tax=Clostridium sp. TaxID=1506 RepID=UPI00346479D2
TTDIAEKINVINNKDKELSDVEKKINDLESSITDLQNETKILEEGIKEKEIEFKEKEELLDERLRAIYKNNTYSELFFVIFESNSFSDFISRLENIKRMVTYDKDLIEEIKAIQDELKEKEEKLMDDRKNLEDKKGQLDGAKNKLAEEKKALEQSKKELEAMENQKLAKASSLSAEQKKVQKETADLEDINEDIQREIDSIISANGSKGNGDNGQTTNPSSGGWIYPVSAPITSQFGYRVHPVTGEKKLHTGTDFGAPMGAPIKAVKDGQVIFAGLNSGYGKMVIVDHGNGIQTLYAHSSSLNVSTGDKVKQGQVIAKVGSTGMSTGPHLHLEFLVNGSRVNPMSYLG